MAIPDYQAFMRPVLERLAQGEARIVDLLPSLADEFGLSGEERTRLLPSQKKTYLADRAHWARTYLGKAGLTESVSRGVHRATPKGRDLLRTHAGPIGRAELLDAEGFAEWLSHSSPAHSPSGIEPSADGRGEVAAPVPSSTPEEAIEQAHIQLARVLTDELLDLARSFSTTPDRFEQLIVDLLIAMGYGGGDPSMGERLGKSGDGGIDGIVNEDRLGLDAVYLQAKCYAEGNTIGRAAIQKFIGSLTGEGATKGVFVTTSAFSKEARDYAEKVQQRIVLIDGSELARLMIQYGVGVRTRRTYEVKSVDEDYFAPPEGL